MIILLLIIGAVAFFWTMVLMKPNRCERLTNYDTGCTFEFE